MYESHAGCECPPGFSGMHCEITGSSPPVLAPTKDQDPHFNNGSGEDTSYHGLTNGHIQEDKEECPPKGMLALRCQNGGTCKVGEKERADYSFMYSGNEQYDLLIDQIHESQSEDLGGMYCECPDGLAGNLCEQPYTVCGENEHVCLFRTECVKNGLSPEEEVFACKCAEDENCVLDGNTSCEENAEYSKHAFCINGGTCKDIVEGDKL